MIKKKRGTFRENIRKSKVSDKVFLDSDNIQNTNERNIKKKR